MSRKKEDREVMGWLLHAEISIGTSFLRQLYSGISTQVGYGLADASRKYVNMEVMVLAAVSKK